MFKNFRLIHPISHLFQDIFSKDLHWLEDTLTELINLRFKKKKHSSLNKNETNLFSRKNTTSTLQGDQYS